MTSLTFNDVNFHPVAQNDGQIWLSSGELAKALGYAETDSVSKIYNRNKDEFTSGMTMTVKMTVNGINGSTRQKLTRIFSLRGCHLIAMLAKTEIAKKFRLWVLNILDKEVGQPVQVTPKTTVADRVPLKDAVNILVAKSPLNYSDAYKMVHQFMGVEHIDEISKEDLPKAVAYVHSLTLGMPIPCVTNPNRDENIQKVSKLGMAKVRSNYELFKIIDRAMSDIDYANQQLQRNNATHYSVFESVICQTL